MRIINTCMAFTTIRNWIVAIALCVDKTEVRELSLGATMSRGLEESSLEMVKENENTEE